RGVCSRACAAAPLKSKGPPPCGYPRIMRWSAPVLALLTGLVITAGVGATAAPSVPRVPRFGVFQQPLVVSSSAAAPWDTVTVSVRLVSPTGKTFDVGGFYVSR